MIRVLPLVSVEGLCFCVMNCCANRRRAFNAFSFLGHGSVGLQSPCVRGPWKLFQVVKICWRVGEGAVTLKGRGLGEGYLPLFQFYHVLTVTRLANLQVRGYGTLQLDLCPKASCSGPGTSYYICGISLNTISTSATKRPYCRSSFDPDFLWCLWAWKEIHILQDNSLQRFTGCAFCTETAEH